MNLKLVFRAIFHKKKCTKMFTLFSQKSAKKISKIYITENQEKNDSRYELYGTNNLKLSY